MKLTSRDIVIHACVLLGLFLVFITLFPRHNQKPTEVPYSQFMALMQDEKISSVTYDQSSGTVSANLLSPSEVAERKAVTPEKALADLEAQKTQKTQNVAGATIKNDAKTAETRDSVKNEFAKTETASSDHANTSADVINPPSRILNATEEGSLGDKVQSVVPFGSDAFMTLALEKGIRVEINKVPRPGLLSHPLFTMLIFFSLMLVVWWFINRSRQNGGNGILSQHGKSRAKMVDPAQNKVRLKDVAGCDEAKLEVSEFISFLKDKENYDRVGATSPKGILMWGPPGTGKTMLAKAIAGEAGVPFFTTSGSSFVEMFVGVGASRVRDTFELVRQHAPCILFIDEIDALGKARSEGARIGGGSDEHEQTLNELLAQMDGFEKNLGVIVIGATNRPEVLDSALRRPGRFDREVAIPLPDVKGREQILETHGKKFPLEKSVSMKKIARGTPGFSGADLANLLNEAALLAGRNGKVLVTNDDVSHARDKILLGVARGNMMNEKERKIVAYHEAGHAIVAHVLPEADPVHKISILPRSRSLGVTMQVPTEDVYNQDEKGLLAQIAVLCGGRAAEDVALNGTRTVGASNDFHRATQMARRMIGTFAMSDLGVVSLHGEGGENPYAASPLSEKWKEKIDDAVDKTVHAEYDRACQLLRDNFDALERVAQALLKEETIDEERFIELVENRSPTASLDDEGSSVPTPASHTPQGNESIPVQGQLAL